MWTSLLFALATAQATEVGTAKTFGLGFQGGVPATFTGKYWFNDLGGVSFHVGTVAAVYLEGRVQIEQRFFDIGNWSFADLALYWNAGVSTRSWLGSSTGLSIGPTGGVGAEMRFHTVPAGVFVETDAQYYLVDAASVPLGIASGAGGRWYL